MSKNSPRFADTEAEHPEVDVDRRGPTPASPAPPVPLADSASANIVFFETPLAYAYGYGVASVTLVSRRQLVDAAGRVHEDMVVTGLLRASLQSLVHLKAVIIEIEKLAEKAAANAAAADAPAGLPH